MPRQRVEYFHLDKTVTTHESLERALADSCQKNLGSYCHLRVTSSNNSVNKLFQQLVKLYRVRWSFIFHSTAIIPTKVVIQVISMVYPHFKRLASVDCIGYKIIVSES